MSEDVIRTFDVGLRQVLSTLEWAEANVPGTNLQSDIIMLRDVLLPRLASLRQEPPRCRICGEQDNDHRPDCSTLRP